MSTPRTYLDHNATTPPRPGVLAALLAVPHGNPSSIHADGRAARAAIETARARVAALAGAAAGEVIFTSGASEANAAALRPGALRCPDGRPAMRLVTSAAEHPSVLGGHRFPGAEPLVRLDAAGRIDLDDLRARLRASENPTLISVQAANGETGVVQPLAEIAALVRETGAALHVDAVQMAGRLPLSFAALGIDALSVSGHKLGGPMGVGALIVSARRLGPEAALIGGGGQQRGLRGGTENVPGIVGLGLACEGAARNMAQEAERLVALRDAAERVVRRLAPDAVVFGAGACRLPNTLCFAVPGLKAETALMGFDLGGVSLSSGSACSSGKVGRSQVLAAMGISEGLQAGALRVSFGWNSTGEEVTRFRDVFASVLQRLYERRPPRAA